MKDVYPGLVLPFLANFTLIAAWVAVPRMGEPKAGLIPTVSAVCVKFAPSSCDLVGFLQEFQFPATWGALKRTGI